MKRQRAWSGDPRRYAEALHEALLRNSRYSGKAELMTRCVRVTYAGDCHVDLVPYVHVPLFGMYDQRFIVNRRTGVRLSGLIPTVSPPGCARKTGSHMGTCGTALKFPELCPISGDSIS